MAIWINKINIDRSYNNCIIIWTTIDGARTKAQKDSIFFKENFHRVIFNKTLGLVQQVSMHCEGCIKAEVSTC